MLNLPINRDGHENITREEISKYSETSLLYLAQSVNSSLSYLRKTMTLQVTPSAHQDTVAVQAISKGIPIRIT
jgi:hypothetical protein